MNRLIFVLFSLTFCTALFSQNLKLAGTVVSTAGDYSVSAGKKLSWTVGEAVVDLMETSNYTLTIGFQQNWYKIVAIEDSEDKWQAVTYPNPVTDKVSVRFANPGSYNVILDLIDVTGAKVLSGKLKDTGNDEVITFDVSSLKRGLYLLHIYSPGTKIDSVYKIIKQ